MIRLSKHQIVSLKTRACESLPDEACGLILGHCDTDVMIVSDIVFSDNVSEGDKTRSFEIDPSLYIKLQKKARGGAPQVIGVWHSHPNGAPAPSETDRARSVEKNWVWLISGVEQGQVITKGYLTGSDSPSVFTEIEISIS